MKSFFIAVVLISYATISMFGVFGMHIGMQDHTVSCIGALVRGTDCPKLKSSFEHLTFHLNAVKSFSLAISEKNSTASILALTLLIVGTGLVLFLSTQAFPQLDFAYFYHKQHKNFGSNQERQFLSWIALHENSPATR